MPAELRQNTLSLALHGILKPGKPCLASGFVLDANDNPIGPVISGWITIQPSANPPVRRRRGRKENHTKKIAVRLADLCWRGPSQLQGVKADQKLCDYFGYTDPRQAKKDLAKAKRLLPPRSLYLAGSGESPMDSKRYSMGFLFEGFPTINHAESNDIALIGAGYSWIEPDREAIYNTTLTLRLTAATRIKLETLTVTLADMARIPAKPA